ncbi:MAG: site-specific DNA-methyltransferase [Pirellulales bacterium]|nr:site-specific DNA-methyltransferase [Pirellulales bacterium]
MRRANRTKKNRATAARNLRTKAAPLRESGARALERKWGTKPGQLWTIASRHGGAHRLLCGDATRAEDVLRAMDGAQAALVATDPPYVVDYTGDRPRPRARKTRAGKDWTDLFREPKAKDARAFFAAVFQNVLAVLADHAAIYVWHAHKRHPILADVWRELGILEHQQIVWVKPASVFGPSYWHWRHECCLMGWRRGSQPPYGPREHNSVWEVDYEGKKRIVGNLHPTQKPVELFARPIRRHTQPGDVCFEPFCGSGSQLVAAERIGRRCYAIELEPAFVAVALERMADMGLEPKRER